MSGETLTLTLCDSPRQALRDCGERCTDASAAAFHRAWCRAAILVADEAGVTCLTLVNADRHPEAASRAAIEEEDRPGELSEWAASVWQAAHDSMHSSRPGRWSFSRKAARAYGVALATSYNKLRLRREAGE